MDARGPVARGWGGWAKLPPGGVAVREGTVWDLASLTKVVATVPLAVLLAQENLWRLDDPVSRWLPGYPQGAITLRHCLVHDSGLPAHVPFHASSRSPAEVRSRLFAVAPEAAPGERVLYSDLNYMLLGWAIEACSRRPLARFAQARLFGPLGMTRTRYRPPAAWRPRIAATEAEGSERPQPGLVWGSVHDGNAHALDGVSGHAGVFSDLRDLARFARALLQPDRHPVLSAGSIREMTRRQSPGPDVRGLGWRLQPLWLAEGWPESAYGHTGFTGTSILVAPDPGVGVVLLSNAVHPVRRDEGLVGLRRAFHQALARLPLGGPASLQVQPP